MKIRICYPGMLPGIPNHRIFIFFREISPENTQIKTLFKINVQFFQLNQRYTSLHDIARGRYSTDNSEVFKIP